MLNTHWIWFLVLLGPKLFFKKFSPTFSKTQSFLFFPFTFSLSGSGSCTPSPPLPHPSVHILKSYITRIKLTVSELVTNWFTGGFPRCLWVLWLGSRAMGTGIHFWQGLFDYWCLEHFSCRLAQLDPWIARPHVKATLDSNCWFSLDVAASF